MPDDSPLRTRLTVADHVIDPALCGCEFLPVMSRP
jgi:hypothetical protein